MAFPTAVNSQITDSAPPPVDPAQIVGRIYQSLAHSTGLLFENAVAAQQQLQASAQAATNQGVMQIYSSPTMASAAATDKVAQSDVPDNMLALLTALRAQQADTLSAVALPTPDAHPHDAAVAHAVRETASALQAAMDATGRALHAAQWRILRNAALAATLDAMIRAPEQTAVYAPLLKAISELD